MTSTLSSAGKLVAPLAGKRGQSEVENGRVTVGERQLVAVLPPPQALPVTRELLETLAQPALNALGEVFGLPQSSPSVKDLLAAQNTEWFPFVRAWTPDLLAEQRVLLRAREVAGVLDGNTTLLLAWKDAVLKFASVARPALIAARKVLQLAPFCAFVADVDFDGAALALARGELRSRSVVKAQLGAVAGDVFEQILVAERPSEELQELENEIADPSDGVLRLGKLKRHKRMLDYLSRENQVIDLTVRDGDDDEERETIIACQNKLRAFAADAGLNVRGTPIRMVAKQELVRKDVFGGQRRAGRKEVEAKDVEHEEEAEQEQ